MKKILSFIAEWYQRDKKIIIGCVCAGFIFTLCFGFCTKSYSATMQDNIAREVIRYHVLANSDSDEDQALKMLVKDKILEHYHEDISACGSKEETASFLRGRLSEIEELASEIIQEAGYDYDVTATLSQDYFPTKTYGDASFPAGMYDALRIEIGSGSGQNWWCLMFPPLCFVDVACDELSSESKKDLQLVLDEDAYDLIMYNETGKSVLVEIRFKLVDMWQKRR